MDPFIGEIRMFTGTYAPQDWLLCWGQTLPITQYQALFAIIGTQFGGDGRTNFLLPDLRGRIPVCAGAGANLTPRNQGDKGGSEKVALDATQTPAHIHPITNTATATHTLTVGGSGTIKCSNVIGNTMDPTGAYPAKSKTTTDPDYCDASKLTGTMASDAVLLNGATLAGDINVNVASTCQPAGGGGLGHDNMQPFLSINFIIAINGVFPPRP
jgi:microcystin-dependent protein